jgi:tryptophan-rich sensory protein
MNRHVSLLIFLAVVLGGGLLIGFLTMPGEWYASLEKPPFNPPNWLFGPAWTLLYILIAVAGWLVWQKTPTGGVMKVWVAQMILNFLWSPIFFGLEEIRLALIVVLALLVVILIFIVLGWRHHRVAALLFLPYAAWVAFASLLNGSIWWLN